MRLAAAIRAAVRDGRLPVGAALPPSRMLATDLGVSRWTVTEAYGQLITEGYLTGKTGSATRVTWSPRPGDEPRGAPARTRQAPAARPAPPIGFDLGSYTPDLRGFPRRKWVDLRRHGRRAGHVPDVPRAGGSRAYRDRHGDSRIVAAVAGRPGSGPGHGAAPGGR